MTNAGAEAELQEDGTVSDLVDDEAPATTEEEPTGPRAEWYVVHSYSGKENKVKKNLEHRAESMNMTDRILQIVVPTETEIEIKEGIRREVERQVFPGYILIEMIMDEDSWYVVRNTPGVTSFVGMGNKPSPLSQAEVNHIMSRIESDEPRVKVSFDVGERVRIIEGPFAEFTGVVDTLEPEKGKARVMVSFFNRETPVEVDFLQLERDT
ncbi:MAG: transcription termination/antitermination factor NusG [Caldilineaceae bacterium SB0661_bin_32]|uniref:Transcription termination/antitermination protein NusG n=1 Tax=Caldilineaceae bacterium SB0661_bin_32 TaxID=2605255 RepID=A0A6B1D6S9_9CHLR|nr:transcription termination/antitermination protein NusG [Caldilineaceae bacterium]MYC95264.1 transcription termination/antitermination factor NusG [Caldilineaceae bacterium SB0661_bin_32]